MDRDAVRRWLEAAAVSIHEQRDALTELDAAIGDADHGANMDRGFTAIGAKLADLGEVPPGKLLMGAGQALISTVGGAAGPLYGTALRRAGRALGDADDVSAEALGEALQAALDGVVELGKAEPGDKTMVDALTPAVAAFRSAVAAGSSASDAAAAAADAADGGRDATIPLLARKGRASYLGERSVGHQDPGATSSALILRALAGTLAD
jgi:dihydroxyacetone kinase-like protein